ncbi:hypothetical protein RF11_15005 [Thelohanellus kitauei]|uniref:Uncharacterized protein n=1 Tax=Thelohanellus kitauei TaxID=669202 RepID=A0A0C2MQ56_THEKT|nr:hypothetical protein RF11_15005 [Thelohanellus kitauei]
MEFVMQEQLSGMPDWATNILARLLFCLFLDVSRIEWRSVEIETFYSTSTLIMCCNGHPSVVREIFSFGGHRSQIYKILNRSFKSRRRMIERSAVVKNTKFAESHKGYLNIEFGISKMRVEPCRMVINSILFFYYWFVFG